MKPAEQIAEKLWEKHSAESDDFTDLERRVSKDGFLLALREYGELVRQRAAAEAREHNPKPMTTAGIIQRASCAAAIERMPLP